MPTTASSAAADWIALAVVTQAHGVSGRVKIKSFTDPADAFRQYKTLTDETGQPVKFRVTGQAQGQFIIEIEGLTRREDTERWRGKKLGVVRAALPALKNDNQFYTADLIGLSVVTTDGQPFGTVREVANYGAGDVVEIDRTEGGSEMFAFTHATFPQVDVAAGRITIDPPELLGSRAEEEGRA